MTFTTYERPSLAENKPIIIDILNTDSFNLGRLILSIAGAFSHDDHAAKYHSFSLAETVEELLSMDTAPLTRLSIAETTYEVLKRFDQLAAIQYGAKHHLVNNVRRRGRPSLISQA